MWTEVPCPDLSHLPHKGIRPCPKIMWSPGGCVPPDSLGTKKPVRDTHVLARSKLHLWESRFDVGPGGCSWFRCFPGAWSALRIPLPEIFKGSPRGTNMRPGQNSTDDSTPGLLPGSVGKRGFRSDPRRAAFMQARTLDLIVWLRARRWPHADHPYLRVPATPAGESARRNPPCVRCGCVQTQRWGSFRGRQRWRCVGCRRTFSDLTGTIFFRTWEPGAWLTFVEHLKETPTVRESARAVGINKDTALRWRHRLLDALGAAPEPPQCPHRGETSQNSVPGGSAESASTFLGAIHPIRMYREEPGGQLRSGRVSILLLRNLEPMEPTGNAEPRTLPGSGGGSHRGIVLQRAILPGAADATARTISKKLAEFRCDPARLVPHLRDRRILREAAISAGWETPHPLAVWTEVRSGSREAGGSRSSLKQSVSAREEQGKARAGFREMDRYIGQFKGWLRRFRGVADVNLQRYLDWYLGSLTPDPALRAGVSRAQALLILASRLVR